MNRILTFDVGKTSCRGALFEGATRLASAEVSGSSGVADRDGVGAALWAMREVGGRLGAGTVDALCAGLAGMEQALARAHDVAGGLATMFGTSAVTLTSDMTTSHVGALQGGAGVVIAAGTGAVALAVATRGSTAVVDGWGYLLGDAGSGHAIGRAGLASALRHHDGRGGSPALAYRAEQRFGRLGELAGLVHGSANPAGSIASFTYDVVAAAEEGDGEALAILQEAGRQLALTAATAGRRIFDSDTAFDVATAGGLLDAGPLLREPFGAHLAALAPPARLVPRRGDALDGARLLATRSDLPHAALVHRPFDEPAEPSGSPSVHSPGAG